MAFGNGQQLSFQLLSDGSYHSGINLRLPEDWSKANPLSVRQGLVQEYSIGWPDMLRNMLINSDDDFRAWPLYAMPTDSLSWRSVPGVVLIGDAAHVTYGLSWHSNRIVTDTCYSTPFAGEGVNCAMHDSIQLAEQIRKHGVENLHQAVAEYEQEMFPRAIDLISRSAHNGEMLMAPDAPKRFLQMCGVVCE